MSELRTSCEHGLYDPHQTADRSPSDRRTLIWCLGGHPVEGGELLEALNALDGVHAYVRGDGETVWWCEEHFSSGDETSCARFDAEGVATKSAMRKLGLTCRMVERFLIPLSNSEGEK